MAFSHELTLLTPRPPQPTFSRCFSSSPIDRKPVRRLFVDHRHRVGRPGRPRPGGRARGHHLVATRRPGVEARLVQDRWRCRNKFRTY